MSYSESEPTMESAEQEDIGLPAELSNIPFQELNDHTDLFELRRKKIKTKKKEEPQFRRENKNRPTEMSSKRPKKQLIPKSVALEEKPRDPRFDKRTGEFNEQDFRENYKFLSKIKKKEYKILSEKLKDTETSSEEREKIKFLIQRQKNQNRELIKTRKEAKLRNQKREFEISQLKQGKKPFYQKKSAHKLFQLAEQFEDLKKKGALSKHMKRHRKKKLAKDRMKIESASV